MKNKKLLNGTLATLIIGVVFATGAVRYSEVNIHEVKAAETTLTIKGHATQLGTSYANGEDITSDLQGVDSNIIVRFYRRGAATTYTILNNASQQIRLYNYTGDLGQYITVTTKAGYSIKDVTVNWDPNNGGASNYTSGVLTNLDLCTCQIENIGNTSGTSNGQVRINSIVLTYKSY